MSHYTMLYKYGERTRQFLGRFYFHFSLVFYNFEAFLRYHGRWIFTKNAKKNLLAVQMEKIEINILQKE